MQFYCEPREPQRQNVFVMSAVAIEPIEQEPMTAWELDYWRKLQQADWARRVRVADLVARAARLTCISYLPPAPMRIAPAGIGLKNFRRAE